MPRLPLRANIPVQNKGNQGNEERVAEAIAAEIQEEQLVDPINQDVNQDPINQDPDLPQENRLPQDPIQEVDARNNMNMLQNLKAEAKAAYDLVVVEDKYDTALAIMQGMEGVIDADNPAICNMLFTDFQLEELFKRYCEKQKSQKLGNNH
jgi:hypothetical protein